MDMIPQKRCTKCNNFFPATSDYFQKHTKLGLQPRCKTCRHEDHQIYLDAHREEVNAHGRERYAQNREEHNARSRAYTQRNREAINERRRHAYEHERDKRLESGRKSYQKNKERVKATHRAYYISHHSAFRDRGRVNEIRKRAIRRSVTGKHTSQQIQEQLKRQNYRCYYAACGFAHFPKVKGRYRYHIEHTFPISRVAGTDIPANDMSYIVLSCKECNESKGTRYPWEWPEGGRLL